MNKGEEGVGHLVSIPSSVEIWSREKVVRA